MGVVDSSSEGLLSPDEGSGGILAVKAVELDTGGSAQVSLVHCLGSESVEHCHLVRCLKRQCSDREKSVEGDWTTSCHARVITSSARWWMKLSLRLDQGLGGLDQG